MIWKFLGYEVLREKAQDGKTNAYPGKLASNSSGARTFSDA